MAFDTAHIEGIDALEESLYATVEARRRLNQQRRDDEVCIVNMIQFLLLFNYDLRCLLEDIRRHREAWHRKLYARHLIVTMFECTDDLTSLLGKNLRNIIDRRIQGSALLQELNGLHETVSQFKSNNDITFRKIRVQVLAHREHDASVQLEILQNLDVRKVEECGCELLEWITECLRFFDGLLECLEMSNNG